MSAEAGDLKDASQIVNRTNNAQYYAANDGRALVRMKIVDSKGRSQRRQFAVLRRDLKDGGDQNYLVVFDQPADVRNTAFLVKKHANKDDDRWLYLPGLDLVKRIAASDERTSFVGTHFFYEDISGRHPDEDKHELLETTDTEYVVEEHAEEQQGRRVRALHAAHQQEDLPAEQDRVRERAGQSLSAHRNRQGGHRARAADHYAPQGE